MDSPVVPAICFNPPQFGCTCRLQGMSNLVFSGCERDEPLCFEEHHEKVFTKALKQFSHALLLRLRLLAVSLLGHIGGR